MEVTAPREFSPKSERPQTLYPKFKTMEPSVKTSAASEKQGNVNKETKTTTANLHVVLFGCQKDLSCQKVSQLAHQKPV